MKTATPTSQVQGIYLERNLLGNPDRMHRLCLNHKTGRHIWSTWRKPISFSVADLVTLAPRLELFGKHVFFKSFRSLDANPPVWSHGNAVLVGREIRVIFSGEGVNISYDKLLAILRGEHLPNRWFFHPGVSQFC